MSCYSQGKFLDWSSTMVGSGMSLKLAANVVASDILQKYKQKSEALATLFAEAMKILDQVQWLQKDRKSRLSTRGRCEFSLLTAHR
jgi:hypothetical protein